ncbi:hypothetical protein OG689_23730 [Kitasatospora sp. NBC_00240]|uniref:hypothetical protein n=1 Tax=Kitasatospora sp. NBC_00240 TaxID=2903567 RepID=UPI002253A52A|nr:hypothetical protein [Kitasatospora sp. NBC_00240]MCX5212257.1 hypothetical protein [Kitasatospora sp. NBC_00240]
MAENRARCPGCDRADAVTTVRAAYADHEWAAGEPFRQAVAPPEAAGPPPRWDLGGAVPVLAVFGGLLLVGGVNTAASDGIDVSSSYQLGRAFSGFVLPVLLLAAAGARYLVLTLRHRERLAVHAWETGVGQRRAAVWEAALLCRRCEAAFFPDGVLRPDFPASPLIPPASFPLMVATMAERAYGGVPVPVPVNAVAAGPPARPS